MDVISFIVLFLGLTAGPHPVQVAVTGPVASVELRLDGHVVGTAREEPWIIPCDFGEALLPHALEAVAFDSEGKRLGSCRQWVNLPRRDAEAEILLERNAERIPIAARVTWDSLEFERPNAITVTLDGVPLSPLSPLPSPSAAATARFALPALTGARLHMLTAKVAMPRGGLATAEIAFGGAASEEATAELTALPIVPGPGAGDLPLGSQALNTLGRIENLFSAGGSRLRVVGIEEGPAEVTFVCDASARAALARPADRDLIRTGRLDFGSLRKDDGVRFMVPRPSSARNRGRAVHLFDYSQRFTASDGGIPRLLMSTVSKFLQGGRQEIADAVAVAGLQAASHNRPRAVVVLLGAAKDDHATYTVPAVRRFLEALHVPIVVWSVVPPDSKRAVRTWGPAEDVSTARAMAEAAARLRSLLEAQRIVWVAGKHLPQKVALAPSAPFAFAGAP